MPSFLDDDLDLRPRLLERWNLSRNPFHKDPPPDDWIDRIFVGRRREMRQVLGAILELPRNVMIRGGYGMGKTTFVKKLLHELAATTKRRFLVAYQPLLGDRPLDFQNTVLKALAGALKELTPEAGRVEANLLANHPYDHPDLAIQSLIEIANQNCDRVVVAIDELEKRPNRTIQDIIIQCRPILDLPCSFVIPGRILDAMSHVDSSAFGAFIDSIDLEAFDRQGAREILLRTLSLSRLQPDEVGLQPFEEPVVERLIADSQGIPRVIHALAWTLFEGTISAALDAGTVADSVSIDHYETYLVQSGAVAYAGTDQRSREVIRLIEQHGGYLDQSNLASLLDEDLSLDTSLQIFEGLAHHDLLIKTESASSVRYTLEPTVERFLAQEKAWKATLAPLWQDVRRPEQSSQERGKRLEDFAAELFGRVFKVVERNLRTTTEELDLVLEYPGGSAIWAKTPRLLVECKNWSSNVAQSDISAVGTKARLDDLQLVFVLAVAGFTVDARIQAERIRQRDRTLFVLIEGKDIERFLVSAETADDFLLGLHRRAQLNARP